VRCHQDRLYSIALRLTGHPSDAEEVAQDAFVRAYRALSGYDRARIEAMELRPWLTTIVVNLCRNRARGRKAATTPIHADDGQAIEIVDRSTRTPGEHAERRESVTYWAGLVARLPERYRTPIVLRHVDGLGYDEMSDALGRPEGTLKAQVHRGLVLLRAAHDASERNAQEGARPQEVLR
jgi:RNA polymerase sigma factor (sigma-70 family)